MARKLQGDAYFRHYLVKKGHDIYALEVWNSHTIQNVLVFCCFADPPWPTNERYFNTRLSLVFRDDKAAANALLNSVLRG